MSAAQERPAPKARKPSWQASSETRDDHQEEAQRPRADGHTRGDTSRLPGMTLTDFWFETPLDQFNRARDDATLDIFAEEMITVFVREVVSTGREHWRQPALLYLEGGPGCQAPRPLSRSGWLQRALEEYRVYLLDQRGCGLSTQISRERLQAMSPAEQAAFFCLFRADSIVADCEVIRRELLGEQGRWTLLAQSYGGWISMHYLSVAPQAVEVALFAGALPPVGVHIDDVYRATYRRLVERNRRYYERYPMDVQRVHAVLDALSKEPVDLPGGGVLTPRRFLQLGLRLGALSGFETLHFMLEGSLLPPYCAEVPLHPASFGYSGFRRSSSAGTSEAAASAVAAPSTPRAEATIENAENEQPQRTSATELEAVMASADVEACEQADPQPDTVPGSAAEWLSTGVAAEWLRTGISSQSEPPTAPAAQTVAGSSPPRVSGRAAGHARRPSSQRQAPRRLSPGFLQTVVNWQPFELQPIYSLMHESIYMCDGMMANTNWAADRILKEFQEFELWKRPGQPRVPAYFTGEMMYPWMFDGDYEHLQDLREAAHIISAKSDWPVLYSIDAIRACQVPCAAAVYYEDIFVEASFSENTGRLLPNCKMWITNEYQHSGLQDDGYNILAKLLNMVRGGLQIPS